MAPCPRQYGSRYQDKHPGSSSRCYRFGTFIPTAGRMPGQQGTGLPLWRHVVNHLALIRERILKAQRLHQAQLASVSNTRAQIF